MSFVESSYDMRKSVVSDNLEKIAALENKEHSGTVSGYSISACQLKIGEILRVVANSFPVSYLEADYSVKDDNKYINLTVTYRIKK